MHVKTFLHTLLCSVMHLKRLNTLILLVLAAFNDKKLSVTQLGRSMSNKAQEKNNIKRSDRFIGNKKVFKERLGIYKIFCRNLIGGQQKPCIIVDWSHIPNSTHQLLRAALVLKGRALSLYEEVYPQRLLNNERVHKKFLKKLKKILPDNCNPIFITDAGFHGAWFEAVKALGWHYLGRVRGNISYRLKEPNSAWKAYFQLFKEAGAEGKSLGEAELAKTNPIVTYLYLIKLPKKQRQALNKLKKKSKGKNDKEHAKAANEPWFLASSLEPSYTMTRRIFKIYSTRMQIEEGFRDLKSSQFGFSFEKSRSLQIGRIKILLMIAMIASAVAYITGWVAEKKNWQFKFQANSIKTKRILSLFYLGCRVIKKKLKLSVKLMLLSFEELSQNFEAKIL